ncbi:MAG TPA: beta-1,6-N-acetylglucosaminyltransferase [Candidatus Methylomirabilis sp.]|nr:beta-1,6-N-acetylglucosaminyltransferase [Candidatus Methylomirabilis sp.]
MRIAYLIMAHDNFAHLSKLIKALDDRDVVFYIHFDAKVEIPESSFNLAEKKNVIFVDRIAVWWGGWSQTQLTLNLLKKAAKENFDYYILISGVDYPIRRNSFLYDRLEEGGEYMNIIKGFQPHKPLSRVRNYYFDGFDRRDKRSRKTKFFLTFEKILRKLKIKKRHFPFEQVYHGSAMWALSHGCVRHILDFTEKNPKWVRFYKTSLCSDEGYIPTVVGNSEFFTQCKGNLTFTDWSADPPPAIIDRTHVEQFKKGIEFESSYGKYIPFFARKFNDECGEVVEQINRELRV